MRELLASPPTAGAGLPARVDVRIKLLAALALLFAVLASSRVVFPVAVLALCLGLCVIVRVRARWVILRLSGPLAIAVMICILRAVMTGAVPWFSVRIGGWRLTFTHDGFAAGALIGLHIVAGAALLLVLYASAGVHEIFGAFRWMGMPRICVEIAMTMQRYLSLLAEQAGSVLAAQKLRLCYAGMRRSLASMGSFAGIVALRSIDQADRTHQAMVARGYRGLPCLVPLPPLGAAGAAVIGGLVALITVAFFVAERWPR